MKARVTINKQNNKLLYERFPKWLLAAILYGVSWSYFAEINLSFIAWFAFIPLFIDLENRNTFREYYSRALFFIVVSYTIICHGFLFTAQFQLFIFIGAASELFMASISFALIYPIKKKYGFNLALTVLPFVISLWEWLYQQFEHTTGYVMLSNSQCRNVWLIQYIDIFGVWSIACWVMLFNVLLFFQYRKFLGKLKSAAVNKNLVIIFLVMIAPPLCYYAYNYSRYSETSGTRLNFTLINTNFSVDDSSPKRWTNKIERLVFLTDSVDYELKQNHLQNNLFVWHEGALDYGNNNSAIQFIDTVVNDWGTPLLTGMQFMPENAGGDNRKVNRAALFDINNQFDVSVQSYDKVRLFPIREKVPYHNLLTQIPFIKNYVTKPDYLKEGDGIKLIEIKTQNGNAVKIGTPICQEQNYSYIWNEMALKGAQCFVQLSYESWWTLDYFKKQMADITRLRCIETHRYAARCSNGGVTDFIDPLGRIYSSAGKSEGAVTASVALISDGATFFSKHQNLFPLLCLAMVFSIIIYTEVKKSRVNS